MGWPAHYQDVNAREGAVYVTPAGMAGAMARYRPAGQGWRWRDHWTTYRPKQRLTFKRLDRLDVKDEADFWSIMDQAKRGGCRPPSSHTDMFLSVARLRLPSKTAIAPFRGFTFGGWQQAFHRGEWPGTVYHYDLNKAYRWASTAGLPETRSAFRTFSFETTPGMFLVRVPVGTIPYARSSGVVAVTSEERDALGLLNRPHEFLFGLGFRRTVDFADAWQTIDARFPVARDRISRAYWGLWNTNASPECVSLKTGRFHDLPNPYHNPIWAAWITSRVKLRLLTYRAVALHVYVDAVHTAEALPLGCEVGEWKLVGTYHKWWCRAPGVWGDGPYTLKHIGKGSVVLLKEQPWLGW